MLWVDGMGLKMVCFFYVVGVSICFVFVKEDVEELVECFVKTNSEKGIVNKVLDVVMFKDWIG